MIQIVMLIAMILMGGCSFKPEDPGLCRLSCSNAIIASSSPEYQIKLATAEPKIYCSQADAALSGPVMMQFVVSEVQKEGEFESRRPVPAISFEPIIQGAVATNVYNDENVSLDEDGNLTPYRYLGISTPKSNWCSDTCGVMTIEVVPVCPGIGITSEVSVQMHSGALYSEPGVVSVENTVAE